MTETRMQLEDWLDDLCVRFIINLPEEDLSSVARICFQVEEAQWFYEDFIRPLDPLLPSMSLRSFCLRIFQHCPLLSAFSADNHMMAFEEFLLYKTRVPVRGAIMLNEAMDSVVLVKGWKKGANWSFPRGKINKDEDDLDCAVREVYEETGYDIKKAGLVPVDEDVKYIEITMREQHMRLYVFRDVPTDTHFEPRTRKEISKIQWYRLSELPAFRKKGHQQTQHGVDAAVNANKFYMVAPFLVPLKKWVGEQKKKDAQIASRSQHKVGGHLHSDILSEEESGMERIDQRTLSQDHGVNANHAAGVDTLQGATAALHRLLKIQPPTLGLQPEASSAVHSPASKNSGEALLALLQGKSHDGKSHDGNPQSDRPGPLPFSQSKIMVPDASIPQPPRPGPPHLSNLPPLHESSLSFLPHQPNPNPVQGNYTTFEQTQMSNQYLSLGQNLGHFRQTYQAQKLEHPQPLPPQVQRTVFTGDQAHGPLVQHTINQLALQGHAGPVSFAIPEQHFPNIHQPTMTSTAKQYTPKLTSHSLALLNAFKNHRNEVPSSVDSRNDGPLHHFPEANADPPTHMQELSADESQHDLSNHRDGPTIQKSSKSPFTVPLHSNAQPLAGDDHRSSLLNTLKASSGQSTNVVDPAATITTPADIQQASEASSSRQPSVDPSLSVTSVQTKRQERDRTQRQSDFISHIPSLALPSQTQGSSKDFGLRERVSGDDDNNNGHLYYEGSHPRERSALPPDAQPGTSTARAFQPQILKRPQPAQLSLPAELAANPAIPLDPSVLSSLDRPAIQQPGHRQTLLSLFKTRPTSAATALPIHTQPTTTTTIRTAESVLSAAPETSTRSRVDSTPSGGGDARPDISSRRGSHAPISAADKGFLLGYLDAFARGADK